MSDLKQFAGQLVNLTVMEVVELSRVLVQQYGVGNDKSACVYCDSRSKPEYFTPRRFVVKNHYYKHCINKNYLLSHRKII